MKNISLILSILSIFISGFLLFNVKSVQTRGDYTDDPAYTNIISGGSSYDQDLNTSNSPTFLGLTLQDASLFAVPGELSFWLGETSGNAGILDLMAYANDDTAGLINITALDTPLGVPGVVSVNASNINLNGDVNINGSPMGNFISQTDGVATGEITLITLRSGPPILYTNKWNAWTGLTMFNSSGVPLRYHDGGLSFNDSDLIGARGPVWGLLTQDWIYENDADGSIEDEIVNYRTAISMLPLGETVTQSGASREVVTLLPPDAVIQLTFAGSVGQVTSLEMISVSETNFIYQIRGSSGILTNEIVVNWTAHAPRMVE